MSVHRQTEPPIGQGDRWDRCHECGEPIRGIAATQPGTHRFVGCGHRASARFLEPPSAADSTLAGIRTS